VGRKYYEIENRINNSNIKFLEFIHNNLPSDVCDFIDSLNKLTEVTIFSGIIRNFFLSKTEIRDLDIVLADHIEIEYLLSKASSVTRNSFGGYKIKFSEIDIDMWYLKDTWAFNHQKTFDLNNLINLIPATAFFNFSAIIFSLSSKKFIYTIDFVRFLRKKEIDVVYKPNANKKLCVVNTYYYSLKYDLMISEKLIKLLRYLHFSTDGMYLETQKKHFGKRIFYNQEINSFVINRINKIGSSKNKSPIKKIENVNSDIPTLFTSNIN
jgi:hypothetical protein